MEILISLREDPSKLNEILKDNEKILPLVKYFRILTAEEMISKKDQFELFAFEAEELMKEAYKSLMNKSYESIVDNYVLKMGVDFMHSPITALCQALDFSVTIIDLQSREDKGLNILDNKTPKASLCRDGAHYLVIYTKEEMEKLSLLSFPLNIDNRYHAGPQLAITCKEQLPYGSALFVRGSGSGLSWEKG